MTKNITNVEVVKVNHGTEEQKKIARQKTAIYRHTPKGKANHRRCAKERAERLKRSFVKPEHKTYYRKMQKEKPQGSSVGHVIPLKGVCIKTKQHVVSGLSVPANLVYQESGANYGTRNYIDLDLINA